MDWQTITYVLILAMSNLFSVYMTSRIMQNRNVFPPIRKDVVIEPEDEESEDRYGEIWPKDRIYVDEDERLDA
jgi:hypothetical protein